MRLKGEKVGCTLSVHMGYCNHDCAPNCEVNIDEDGFVNIRAKTEAGVKKGEEITISYVDVSDKERHKTLKNHYMFECACKVCLDEKRGLLKAKLRKGPRATHVMMNNKGTGWEFKAEERGRAVQADGSLKSMGDLGLYN